MVHPLKSTLLILQQVLQIILLTGKVIVTFRKEWIVKVPAVLVGKNLDEACEGTTTSAVAVMFIIFMVLQEVSANGMECGFVS